MSTPRFLTAIYHFVFSSKTFSPVWTVARVYLGWEWIHAGYEKVINPVWVGKTAGAALTGFINGALAKTTGVHPDVSSWYAWFLQHAVLPHVNTWSHVIAYGEVLVGAGLILGAFTFLAAFFGAFMNINYLLAGTVSTNPVLLVLALFVMIAHRVAGYIGLDYYILKTGRY